VAGETALWRALIVKRRYVNLVAFSHRLESRAISPGPAQA
jgi:hypothetical protein